MKMNEFRLLFHCALFLSVKKEAIIWTNDGKFTDAYMRHSASMS